MPETLRKHLQRISAKRHSDVVKLFILKQKMENNWNFCSDKNDTWLAIWK